LPGRRLTVPRLNPGSARRKELPGWRFSDPAQVTVFTVLSSGFVRSGRSGPATSDQPSARGVDDRSRASIASTFISKRGLLTVLYPPPAPRVDGPRSSGGSNQV